eukprot:TRINITY_DN16895_c0_g1_i1.p1 TRINITY_DN16895_c0_g1~~TRINITY_DN16895_c0_g1_i1.p1  ORF type:complete len:116 (+),score=9.91 TRINITY_DN16895_c0_g1_i1:38-349(+)
MCIRDRPLELHCKNTIVDETAHMLITDASQSFTKAHPTTSHMLNSQKFARKSVWTCEMTAPRSFEKGEFVYYDFPTPLQRSKYNYYFSHTFLRCLHRKRCKGS